MSTVEDDIKLLKKYEIGRLVDYEDYDQIEELSAIGLMQTGVSIKKKKMTAKTSNLGKKLITPPKKQSFLEKLFT